MLALAPLLRPIVCGLDRALDARTPLLVSPTLDRMRRSGGHRLRVALCVAIAAPALALPAIGAGAATTTTGHSSTTTSGHSTSTTAAATTTTGSGSTTTTTVAATMPSLPSTPAPLAWIVVDADTGHEIDGHNEHTPERTASIVKITTALAALERLPPTARVTISQNAVNHGLSNENVSGLKVGQTWTAGDLVSLMMVISANDAAYALAEGTSGSLQQFALDETATAHALGMRDSTFNDPAGLDDNTSYGGGPRMSPFDVAIAVRDALHVPTIAVPAGTATYTYTDPSGTQHTYSNHNQMLPGLQYGDADVTGFKTGSTQQAGNTLAVSAKRNGRTLIAVLLDCYDRYNWAKALLDRAFLTPAGTSGGAGDTLPAVQDLTYAHRAAVQAAAVKFLTGTRGLGTGGSVPLATATSYRPTTTTAPKRAINAAAHRSKSGGGGISAFEVVLVILLILALAVVVLRRRAVRRKRARREARRRTQAALRRGSLPVVDGRYRAGMRTGKPPQSNVRVHRGRE